METNIRTNTVIGRAGKPVYSKIAIHPGEILKDEVESRDLKKSDLAATLEILPNHLSELFKGKRHINALLAVKLEKALGMEAEFWLQLQMRYELTQVRNCPDLSVSENLTKLPLPKYRIMPKGK